MRCTCQGDRSGFSLIELIVAMVVMAILGTALTQMLISDSRFVDRVDAMMAARGSARSAVTLIGSEYGMLANGSLTLASKKKVTARVPRAFGMTCQTSGGVTDAVLFPTDSIVWASIAPNGIAFRISGTIYNFRTGLSMTTTASTAACDADSITVAPGGLRVRLSGYSGPSPNIGVVFFIYENISYEFKASVDLPGRTGFFRTDGSGATEELLAPFDTSASFSFLIGPKRVEQATAPAAITVAGLVLHAIGESHFNPQGTTEPMEFELESTIVFRNWSN